MLPKKGNVWRDVKTLTVTIEGPYPPTNCLCHIFRHFHVF